MLDEGNSILSFSLGLSINPDCGLRLKLVLLVALGHGSIVVDLSWVVVLISISDGSPIGASRNLPTQQFLEIKFFAFHKFYLALITIIKCKGNNDNQSFIDERTLFSHKTAWLRFASVSNSQRRFASLAPTAPCSPSLQTSFFAKLAGWEARCLREVAGLTSVNSFMSFI